MNIHPIALIWQHTCAVARPPCRVHCDACFLIQIVMPTPLHIIILAAGEGKRMRSRLPKVLQRIAGKPMLAHVLAAARRLAPAQIHVVYGHGGEQVRVAFADEPGLTWVEQAERLGTGHAVQQALGDVWRYALA